jgi:hypothetical protein
MDNLLRIAIPSSHYHKKFSSHLIHGFVLLARQVCAQSGFECFEKDQEDYGDLLNRDEKPFDILVSMGFAGLTPELAEFYKHHNIKVILFQDDIHGKDDKDFRKKKKWIEFADLLLIPYHKNFLSRKEYSSCHSKAINFPWFAPRICFKYDNLWPKRKSQILLSGCMAPVYSLRRNLKELSKDCKYIDILDHPGYKPSRRKHQIIGEKYYDFLTQYKCAIATSADFPLNYPLSKYFEIPACGCVGLFEEIDTLSDFGFEPNKHYIPITKNNYYHTISEVVKHFDKFENMANSCKDLIKHRHMDIHRVCQLTDILNNF